MAEKEPPGIKIIQVQPSKGDEEKAAPIIGKNDNAIKQICIANIDKSRFFAVEPPVYNARDDKIEKSFCEIEITMSKHIEQMFAAKEGKVEETTEELLQAQNAKDSVEIGKEKRKKKKKKKSRKKNNRVLPLDDKNPEHDDPGLETNVDVDGKKKSKKTKIKMAKKRKENEVQVNDEMIKAEESESEENAGEDRSTTGNTSNRRKLPCLFGFISTWLAKRKENRRIKKRKVIASRVSPQRLVEYDHRTAKGGEAFTVEVDNRPCLKKPLLPPIKQTPGPIRHEKLQSAVCRRAENLAQRKDAAIDYEKKKNRCKERKAENDYQFRHRADLGIKQKQANAERNRDIRSRCKSKIRTQSAESFNEPSAESSLGSVHGPCCYSDEEYEQDALSVDEIDIPIF